MTGINVHDENSSTDTDEAAPPASEELFFDDDDLELYERCPAKNLDETAVKPLTKRQKTCLKYLNYCQIKPVDNEITVSVLAICVLV